MQYNYIKYTVVVFVALIICVNGKRFASRCKLVRELNKIGIPNDIFLGSWVCLIEKVSNRDTSAFTEKSGGRKFYGLYQIPNKWCKVGKPGGGCNIACELLLDDDIRDDTACAVNIFDKEGFKYWPVWSTRCKSPDISHITTEIYKCPEFRDFSSSPERDGTNDTRDRRRLS